MKLMSIVGARPNFMKIAPFIAAIREHNTRHPEQKVEHVLVHTGQHYDPMLSDRFFQELGVPAPDHHLSVGSGSHGYQIGTTMIAFEKVLLQERPDWVIVVGDVNAVCACSIIAKKHHFKVALIEAGLRSNDWAMPEEINRVVADRLSDLLFTTCQFADENLKHEGVHPKNVVRVGNIMIDTLDSQRPKSGARQPEDVVAANRFAEQTAVPSPALGTEGFGVLTLHRPSNVDDPASLLRLIELLEEFARRLPIVFPVHPRTAGRLREFGLWTRLTAGSRLILCQPLGYIDLLALTMAARVVLTDSGGIQEECCVVGTPCLTLRSNTERPATLVEHGGTNYLVGTLVDDIRKAFDLALASRRKPYRPPLWDGHTASRILLRLMDDAPVPA